MLKDDLIALAVKLGLGEEIDLKLFTKSELNFLIDSAKPNIVVIEPPKHKFYRG